MCFNELYILSYTVKHKHNETVLTAMSPLKFLALLLPFHKYYLQSGGKGSWIPTSSVGNTHTVSSRFDYSIVMWNIC